MLAGRPGAPGAGDPPGPPDGGGRPRPGASLDMKIHLEKNLEEERQLLLQQQKICRNRARRYFMESNRRKKAFEEKRKEQEEREYQIRERILQQRKQKFEEVTEKFQRAHIPFSQRRKAAFQKPVPPLDEALKQIQESNIKSEVNIPISHHSAVNWRAIDSALSSALSKNDHKHHNYLLRKINCDKETKESNMKDLATNKNEFQLKLEETQKLLQDQHLSSLQKFCDEVYQITNSETLSSVDSLEAAEREKIYLTLTREFAPSMQQNSLSLKAADLQSVHLNCSDEDKLSFSKTQHINNWLTNLDVQNTKSVSSYSNMLSNSSVPPLWECLSNKEQTPATLSRPVLRTTSASNDSVVFVYSPPIVALDKKGRKACEGSTPKPSESTWGAPKREPPQETPRETPSVTESPAYNVSKAWTNPQSFTQEAAMSTIGKKLSEFIQENKTALFVPAATPLVLSPNAQSARPLVENNIRIKEIHPIQCSDKLHELKDVKDEKIKYFNCNKEELPLFSDNFQATSVPQNSNSKDRKQKTAETSVPSSGVIADYDLFDQHKKMKCNTHKQNDVSLLKSILKKESKYEHDCLKTLIINQGFKFRNKKAEAIRDSIELTKEKGKSAEIPKTTKKLRWFDETGNPGSNADNSHSVKNRTGMTHGWSPQHHLPSSTGNKATGVPNSAASTKPRADSLSENVVDLGGAKRDHVPLNCFMPSGCSFTRQAWSACRTPVHNGDSKTQKGKPYKDGGRVLRRAGAAKVQSGSTYMNRKGTVLHPQSASNAKMLTQTQGKLIIPHPPPKPPSNMRSGKNTQVSQCQSIMPENTHNVMAQNCVDSTHVPPVEHSLNQWNQEGSPPLSDACSDLVTVIPSNCSSECQTSAKTHPSSMASQQDGTLHGTQRGPVYEEHYQSFPHMEEDLLFSWKRRTSRLHQNERVTDSTITRRKETVENKWRNHLEQKSTHTGPVGMKYTEQMSNFGQSAQPSSSEPKQGARGSSNTEESTVEFLMADSLLDASDSDDEIMMGAMSKQQKAHVSLSQSQQPSVCALSAEEQKILQSLSRLNHRLYYVQEAICKNPSIKNTLQLIPLPNSQPKASVCPDVGPRLQRKY